MSVGPTRQPRQHRTLPAWLVVAAGFAFADHGMAESRYRSPESLAADGAGKILYVAQATTNQAAAFDPAVGKVIAEYALPDSPSGLVLSPDGARLHVTGGGPVGRVHVLDLRDKGKLLASLPAGQWPTAPVISPDGKTLYVCNRFDDSVSVIDLNDGRRAATVAVVREPVAAAVSPDGKYVFVGNHLPSGRADAGSLGAAVSVISGETRKVLAAVQLPNGSTGVRGVAVSPDGKYAYVTHVLARYRLPVTQLDRGWANTNALSIIDASKPALVNTVLLDDVDQGAANPWGVACSPDGRYVCVAQAGTHEVSVLDRHGLHEKLEQAKGNLGDGIKDDLTFLVGLRRRVKLEGRGPRGLVMVGATAYAAGYFSDSIEVVDVGPDARTPARSWALGPRLPVSGLRRGQMLFHDATICYQQWQSCATCHPGGGRVDGLNWDLLNDGMGSPRSTKSLLLAYQTPPCMVLGVRADARAAVRAGLTHVLLAERPEEDASAIDEYLQSLKPVPSPRLVNGELSAAAKRGREIFLGAGGCGRCHTPPLYTDLKAYDVGSGVGNEAGRKFDTPTLIELWRTQPYLYDGRAASVEEVLKKFNPGDRHGATSGLTAGQISDLAEFILSL